MPARLHVDVPLAVGAELLLPPETSRHVQVLRLQPGDALTLFNGLGGEWSAQVLEMGRKSVSARLLAHHAVERELVRPVTLALGMPANERMDGLVEKATELGVVAIQPLLCERSVLRLAGERAERKTAHWQAIAVAACEQSGRNRVPQIQPPLALRAWLQAQAAAHCDQPHATARLVLSLAPDGRSLRAALAGAAAASAAAAPTLPVTSLSGPEGGLSPAELADAAAAGFQPITLGARVLRADTAPLALLAAIAALDDSAH